MTTSTVFTYNRSQAVRLPAEMRFPDSVKKVDVRVEWVWSGLLLPRNQPGIVSFWEDKQSAMIL